MDIVIGSGQGTCADSQHFYLSGTEVLNVLGPRPRSVVFEARQTSGRKLLMSLAERVAPDTAVRIDHRDVFVLGEVKGCWEDAPGRLLAVVELSQYHPLT